MLEKRHRLMRRLQPYDNTAVYRQKNYNENNRGNDVIKAEPDSDDGRRSPEYEVETRTTFIRNESDSDSSKKCIPSTSTSYSGEKRYEDMQRYHNTEKTFEHLRPVYNRENYPQPTQTHSNYNDEPRYNSNSPLNELTPFSQQQSSEENHTHSQVKRLRANDRERRRVHLINRAMENLRSIIPGLKERKKLTKLELLRAANQYIWILDEALRTGKSIKELTDMLEQQPVVYYVSYACMPLLKREHNEH